MMKKLKERLHEIINNQDGGDCMFSVLLLM